MQILDAIKVGLRSMEARTGRYSEMWCHLATSTLHGALHGVMDYSVNPGIFPKKKWLSGLVNYNSLR